MPFPAVEPAPAAHIPPTVVVQTNSDAEGMPPLEEAGDNEEMPPFEYIDNVDTATPALEVSFFFAFIHPVSSDRPTYPFIGVFENDQVSNSVGCIPADLLMSRQDITLDEESEEADWEENDDGGISCNDNGYDDEEDDSDEVSRVFLCALYHQLLMHGFDV